jgi:AcrR family transcriptional regulator
MSLPITATAEPTQACDVVRITRADMAAATREAVLAAAAKLFLKHGFTLITMRQIATEAQLSTGAITAHFDGKDSLFKAAFPADHRRRRMAEAMCDAYHSANLWPTASPALRERWMTAAGIAEQPISVAGAAEAGPLVALHKTPEDTAVPSADYLALEDERRFWRESATATISMLVHRLGAEDYRLDLLGPKVPRSVVLAELRAWVELLDHSERRAFPPLCEGCGKAVRPGDVCFPYTDVDCHADCAHPTGGKLQAGQQIECDHVVVDDDEEHAGPGTVTLFAASATYTDEQIAEILANAKTLCGIVAWMPPETAPV